jgi:hypothetical protein
MALAQAAKTVSREKIVAAFHAYCAGLDVEFSESVEKIAVDSLEEMIIISTARFDEWWIRNHYRYKTLTEVDRRACRNILRDYVAKFQQGKIEIES